MSRSTPLRRAGARVFWAPTGLGVIFLIATLAIGPGLIVNLGLKDHAHRPRPVHVVEFGGTDEFRPGIASTRLQEELLVRLRRSGLGFLDGRAGAGRAAAVARAGGRRRPGFGAASVLRLAFGGHFLSDVLLGGLIALLVILVTRRLLWPKGGP